MARLGRFPMALPSTAGSSLCCLAAGLSPFVALCSPRHSCGRGSRADIATPNKLARAEVQRSPAPAIVTGGFVGGEWRFTTPALDHGEPSPFNTPSRRLPGRSKADQSSLQERTVVIAEPHLVSVRKRELLEVG